VDRGRHRPVTRKPAQPRDRLRRLRWRTRPPASKDDRIAAAGLTLFRASTFRDPDILAREARRLSRRIDSL